MIFLRAIAGSSNNCLLYTSSLVELARLQKECVIIGAGNRVEIWAKQTWDQLNEEHADDFEEIAERLSEVIS